MATEKNKLKYLFNNTKLFAISNIATKLINKNLILKENVFKSNVFDFLILIYSFYQCF